MDENLYHYFIGRDDQSVNEKVMIGRIDQQIRVNKIMIDVMGAAGFYKEGSTSEKIYADLLK